MYNRVFVAPKCYFCLNSLTFDTKSGRPVGVFHRLIQQTACWECFDNPACTELDLVGQSELLQDWGLRHASLKLPKLKGTPVCDAGTGSTIVMYSWFQVASAALAKHGTKEGMDQAIGECPLLQGAPVTSPRPLPPPPSTLVAKPMPACALASCARTERS